MVARPSGELMVTNNGKRRFIWCAASWATTPPPARRDRILSGAEEKVAEPDRGFLFLVEVVLAGNGNVRVTQCTGSGENAESVANLTVEFLSQRMQGFVPVNSFGSKPISQSSEGKIRSVTRVSRRLRARLCLVGSNHGRSACFCLVPLKQSAKFIIKVDLSNGTS
jgi:hypothetical protein